MRAKKGQRLPHAAIPGPQFGNAHSALVMTRRFFKAHGMAWDSQVAATKWGYSHGGRGAPQQAERLALRPLTWRTAAEFTRATCALKALRLSANRAAPLKTGTLALHPPWRSSGAEYR